MNACSLAVLCCVSDEFVEPFSDVFPETASLKRCAAFSVAIANGPNYLVRFLRVLRCFLIAFAHESIPLAVSLSNLLCKTYECYTHV